MIVPTFWAEAKRSIRHADRALTVRRFGWSDESQLRAEEHARSRVEEAAEQILRDEPADLSEPRTPYNGADGLPIREEIIDRRGDAVLTRNAYGALCLNTPDVLFADVDASEHRGCAPYGYTFLLYTVAYLSLAWEREEARSVWLYLLGGLFAVTLIGSAWHWTLDRLGASPKAEARHRIERFAKRHRDWVMRLYETPRGWRVLVTHDTFDARSDTVHAFFESIGTDPVYVRMCFNQNCFRARVSPKPWRIGINDHMKPRPGVWPVSPERIPQRNQWVRRYEHRSKGFAACRFETTLGKIPAHSSDRLPPNPSNASEKIAAIVKWHDELSAAHSQYPTA